MRKIAKVLLVMGLVCSWLVVGLVNWLIAFPIEPTWGRQAVAAGRLDRLLTVEYFWRDCLWTLPNLGTLVNWRAMLVVGVFVITMAWLLRIKRQSSWLTVSIVCPVVGAGLYAGGMMTLHENSQIADFVGPVVAVMLVGLLYSLIACSFFAALHLIDTPPRARRLPGRPA